MEPVVRILEPQESYFQARAAEYGDAIVKLRAENNMFIQSVAMVQQCAGKVGLWFMPSTGHREQRLRWMPGSIIDSVSIPVRPVWTRWPPRQRNDSASDSSSIHGQAINAYDEHN
jgi:hypothetical protein